MFKVGDKVRIVGPSQTGGNDRRGEIVVVDDTVEDGKLWYNVTISDESDHWTYCESSLEAVSDSGKQYEKALFGQDEITINGVAYVRKVAEKTNAEKVKQYFARNIGARMTFSDFGSDVSTARIADASRTGNRVTVVYDAGE